MKLKILILTILAKGFYLIICGLASFITYLVIDVMWISASIGVTLYVFLYIWILGPMSHVTKEEIGSLVSEGMIEKTKFTLSEKESSCIKWYSESWTPGMGLFDRFQKLFETNYTSNGLGFFCKDIPYLNLHFIPWQNVESISNESETIKEKTKVLVEQSRDIKLLNGKVIILPVSDKAIEHWKAHIK